MNLEYLLIYSIILKMFYGNKLGFFLPKTGKKWTAVFAVSVSDFD